MRRSWQPPEVIAQAKRFCNVLMFLSVFLWKVQVFLHTKTFFENSGSFKINNKLFAFRQCPLYSALKPNPASTNGRLIVSPKMDDWLCLQEWTIVCVSKNGRLTVLPGPKIDCASTMEDWLYLHGFNGILGFLFPIVSNNGGRSLIFSKIFRFVLFYLNSLYFCLFIYSFLSFFWKMLMFWLL